MAVIDEVFVLKAGEIRRQGLAKELVKKKLVLKLYFGH